MWGLPRPGIKSASPALVGGFLTTGPPGKSSWPFKTYSNHLARIWGGTPNSSGIQLPAHARSSLIAALQNIALRASSETFEWNGGIGDSYTHQLVILSFPKFIIALEKNASQ